MEFHQFFHHVIVVLSLMRDHAAAAVFDAVIQIEEVAAAVPAHGIKRAIAENTVIIFFIYCSVTGKVLAAFVTKKFVFRRVFTEPLIIDSV